MMIVKRMPGFWQRCQLEELKVGDVFRLFDPRKLTTRLWKNGKKFLVLAE